MFFPASQLKILPYNRAVHDLNGRTPAEFLAAVKERFTVKEAAAPEPTAPGQVSMNLDGKWYGLSWTPDPGGTAGCLGVAGSIARASARHR